MFESCHDDTNICSIVKAFEHMFAFRSASCYRAGELIEDAQEGEWGHSSPAGSNGSWRSSARR
jgi:hypothetical protein